MKHLNSPNTSINLASNTNKQHKNYVWVHPDASTDANSIENSDCTKPFHTTANADGSAQKKHQVHIKILHWEWTRELQNWTKWYSPDSMGCWWCTVQLWCQASQVCISLQHQQSVYLVSYLKKQCRNTNLLHSLASQNRLYCLGQHASILYHIPNYLHLIQSTLHGHQLFSW